MDDDFDNDIEIRETAEYGNKVMSLKEIALSHIKKISNLMCQELTKGRLEKKPLKMGGGIVITETYKPDLRIAYCNAVEFLTDLVYPWADEPFKKLIDEHYKEELNKIDVEEKIKKKKVLFRELSKMFERTGYFESSEYQNE